MHKVRSTFTISDFMIDELNSISQELDEKKSHIVEKALSMYFDVLDERLADKRLKDLEQGKEEITPADTFFKELGI
ncbi:CopG family transcriptional regulator [Sulfurimonas sp. SAG-AH-194-C21]|nr:CopG family transcriptional regulator [Sulfurimonas sp. SAG-AH-194-C21]MDF1884418.1 CopG family transcriptional regulator [Sulfurimonas sp. SAG-AH-194-C21]